MFLSVSSDAASELARGFKWYEEQRSGLGAEFLEAVDRVLEGVLEFPRRHPRKHGEIRRALLPRFPFAIYCLPLPDKIAILQLRHASRRLPWE